MLNEYYKKNSQYMKFDASRGRILADSTRDLCHSTIIKSFIPYLQSQKIEYFDQIDTPFLTRYQDYLLEEGFKPQSINIYISRISPIFQYLLQRGILKTNPFRELQCLKPGEEDKKKTGYYDADSIKGVLEKEK